MKYEKWTVAPPDPAALAALEEAGISPLLAAVLSARGVRVPQEARALLEGTFLSEQYKLFVAVIAVAAVVAFLALFLRTRLGLAIRATGDNAAMVGAQAYYEYLAGHTAGMELNACAQRSIDLG